MCVWRALSAAARRVCINFVRSGAPADAVWPIAGCRSDSLTVCCAQVELALEALSAKRDMRLTPCVVAAAKADLDDSQRVSG